MPESVPRYGYICLACLEAERHGSVEAWVDELYARGSLDAELEAALDDVLACELRYWLGN
jgi:hypothetical protein